jgi:hypothetical protein
MSSYFRSRALRRPEPCLPPGVEVAGKEHADMGKAILLWFLGIPIPVIILLLLIF